MKKIMIPIGMLLIANSAYGQLTQEENYVQTKTYLDYNASGQPTKISETVQYFDGLGRPKQTVNVKASPLGRDVVSSVVYDQFGRQTRDYLPMPQNGTQNGGIYSQTAGLSGYPIGDPTGIYAGEKIHSEKVLESSPLNRVQEQYQVGNDWTGKPVKFDYDANIDGEVIKMFTTTTWENGATKSTIEYGGMYGSGQLYKNIITDEDGNKTIEFKNGKGQVLVIRKVLSGTENADTYYVYNEYGQLAWVIPPMLSKKVHWQWDDQEALAYQYRYDGRGRLVEKKLPGKGWEYMVYDKSDRLILSQDANMRSGGKWLITKYDKLGRVVYTGIYPGGTSRASLQEQVGSLLVVEDRNGSFSKSGIGVYYTNNVLNQVESVLTINYYDTYVRQYPKPTFPETILEQKTLATTSQDGKTTKGLPVMSFIKNIEDDNWTKNYTYYDMKGRVIGTHSINHLGGYTRTESKLDFAGLPLNTITTHKRLDSEAGITIAERFVYDSQNRLLQHWHKVDSKPEQLLAENTYNELSQLKNKKVGNNLQSIDYAYNIRGWMTDINKDQMEIPDLGGKLFSYKIKYNQKTGITNPDSALFPGKDVKPKYNGNIAEVDWRAVESLGANPSLTPKRYGYAYDSLNRLTAGYYQNPQNPNSKEHTESLDYDLNGNIMNLYRTSALETGNTATVIDRLRYNYADGGNKLTNIIDDQQNPAGYEGGGNTITYDSNGNMTNMKDKNIGKISYNFLNLTNKIENINETLPTMVYTYRADGIKVHKTYMTMECGFSNCYNVPVYTDYLDGFQYVSKGNPIGGGGSDSFALSQERDKAMEVQAFSAEVNAAMLIPSGNGLHFFPTAEGFYDYTKNQYIYQYKDHLGNVRISFGRTSAGALEITDANDYYPFGMNHLKTGNAFFGQGNYKNYKYLGQELQETGFYDLNARFYMPDAVVFGQHDPLSEKTLQPYAYGYNNPVRYGDPTGLSGNDFVQRKDGSIYWDKNATSQATTKAGAGETYLGKDLTFTFNSYIDPKLWDGPLGGFATGDKLTSTITVSSNTDADNNLLSVDIKSSEPIVHKTGGLIPNNDYFPGQQNVGLNIKGMKNGSVTYEQHARVNGFDKLGIEAMGYSAPNVAQKLSIGLSGNNLSVTAATDVYPSAKLNVNSSQLFKYNQPSFKATFGKEFVGYRESRSYGNDAPIPVYRSLTPSPSFYTRYKK